MPDLSMGGKSEAMLGLSLEFSYQTKPNKPPKTRPNYPLHFVFLASLSQGIGDY